MAANVRQFDVRDGLPIGTGGGTTSRVEVCGRSAMLHDDMLIRMVKWLCQDLTKDYTDHSGIRLYKVP
jgi:hypothetical protein